MAGGESVPDALNYDACGMQKDLRIISVSNQPVRGPRPMKTRSIGYYKEMANKKRPAIELLLSRVDRDSLTGLISHFEDYFTRNSFSGDNGP